MKKLLITAAAFAVISGGAAGKAEAQTTGRYTYDRNMYVSGSLGYSFLGESEVERGIFRGDLDNTFGLSGAIGRSWGPNSRGELELQYREADIDAFGIFGDVETWGIFANGYYDFDLGMAFEPYVMGGLGAMVHDASTNFTSNSDTVFAWQVGAGINADLSPQVQYFTGYRYQNGWEANLGPVDLDYENHEILAGLRWYFG